MVGFFRTVSPLNRLLPVQIMDMTWYQLTFLTANGEPTFGAFSDLGSWGFTLFAIKNGSESFLVVFGNAMRRWCYVGWLALFTDLCLVGVTGVVVTVLVFGRFIWTELVRTQLCTWSACGWFQAAEAKRKWLVIGAPYNRWLLQNG